MRGAVDLSRSAGTVDASKVENLDNTNINTTNNDDADDTDASSKYSDVNFNMDDGGVDDNGAIESTAAPVKVVNAPATAAAASTVAVDADRFVNQRLGARDARFKLNRQHSNGGASHSEPPRRLETTDTVVAAAPATVAAFAAGASPEQSPRVAARDGIFSSVEKQQRVARDAVAAASSQQPTH
ncbi:hypothetical protein BDR26DRAFT_899125 [Obelidium mucronatum]|nr:hypothetical protein BDR26DRAFT_899125 [Obelidium mucronatum]